MSTVLQQDAGITAEWIATTEGFVNAEIRPKVSGYVVRQVYKEGTFVKQGQVLFEIDARQSKAALEQANSRMAAARVALVKAQQDVVRYRPLAAEMAVSRQELETAEAAEASAQADVLAAQAALDQANLTMQWTRVTSPIDGVSGVAAAQVGSLVGEQTVMTTVSTLDPIKVSFHITENEYLYYSKLIAGAGVDVAKQAFVLILSNGATYPHRGDVILADREVDPKTGTIVIKASFPNPGNVLRPGQFAKIRTVARIARGALLVPQRAISELQSDQQVAVVGPDNKVSVRVVKVGAEIGPLYVIDEGLSPGDRVVVEGFQRVRSGMTVDPKPGPPITLDQSSLRHKAER